MDTLQSELAELKTFIADLKADRAAQKEKERKEAWTNHTHLSIALGSICLLTKKKPLWYVSLLLGLLATVYMVQVINQ